MLSPFEVTAILLQFIPLATSQIMAPIFLSDVLQRSLAAACSLNILQSVATSRDSVEEAGPAVESAA